MVSEEVQSIFAFINKAEQLKDTLRFAFTASGKQESAAEHSWRLCLLVMVCSDHVAHLSLEKMLRLALVHDLPEAVCGDTVACEQSDPLSKSAKEREAMRELARELPPNAGESILALWEEYEAASSEEARYVKALDKIETLMQHNQGRNPESFDYSFNLGYGRGVTDAVQLASQLRALVDADTRQRLAASLSKKQAPGG